MNWIFWVLLIVALLLLVAPLAGVVAAALRATFWIIGAILLIAAIVWAITTLSRGTPSTTAV